VPDADDRPDATARPAPDVSDADVRALDVDGVGAVLAGTIAWTAALIVCLLLRDRLAADGTTWWIWVCGTGALVGLPGLWFVRRRRAAYAAVRQH